jgi:subtilase family serine protease
MKIEGAKRLLSWFGLLAVLTMAAVAVAAPGVSPKGRAPQLLVGPKAAPAGAATPGFGLFTCQVGLAPFVCYDPYQMRTAYGVDQLIGAGFDGAGHTIVIIDAFQSPTLVDDLTSFTTFYGLPPANLVQIAPDGLTPFDPSDNNMIGWAGEITLDVEWSHAIAPRANIVLVLAKSNQDNDILSALKYAVDHNLGDVISMSFGENESCLDSTALNAWHDVFAQATQKSISLFASSGDQGAAQPTCDGASWAKAVSHPASDPLVSGVGGTELHAAGYCLSVLGCNPAASPPPGTYDSEIAWNEFATDSASTGGGFSVIFDAPPYQKSAVKSKLRAVPDVAYNAAIFHGVLTVWTDTGVPGDPAFFFLFGGTSAGAPQWAGITAIANQVAGHRLGYLNSAFYRVRQTPPNYGASFHDVVVGDNSVVETDSGGNDVAVTGFDAGPAWDATTGIGSPKTEGLVSRLIGFVSPGDAVAAIATSKPKPNAKPPVPGAMKPH